MDSARRTSAQSLTLFLAGLAVDVLALYASHYAAPSSNPPFSIRGLFSKVIFFDLPRFNFFFVIPFRSHSPQVHPSPGQILSKFSLLPAPYFSFI